MHACSCMWCAHTQGGMHEHIICVLVTNQTNVETHLKGFSTRMHVLLVHGPHISLSNMSKQHPVRPSDAYINLSLELMPQR